MREAKATGNVRDPEGPKGQTEQSQLWLFIISIMQRMTHPAGGERHLQVAILIDINKDVLTVTMATVAISRVMPGSAFVL